MDTDPIIFFVGKPGSGKTTQAKYLSEKKAWPVFTSGEAFRALAKEDTPVGHKVKESTEAGLLMPSWFASYVYLRSFFALPSDSSGAIFDGAGRTAPEAEIILDSLVWLGRPFIIFSIVASDEAVTERLGKRSVSSGRADDYAVAARLAEYRAQTEPAVSVLRRSPSFIEIDGERTPEAIAQDILSRLSRA